MFYTLIFIDGRPELVSHETLSDAEGFAREAAGEGETCTVLQIFSTVEAAEQPASLEEYYGLQPGRDFPGSLHRSAI